MADYEKKIIQVYPSDAAEQRAISAYEAGGWELDSSDRIQEVHGDTRSTFIRLRFRRDRDMPNYDRIKSESHRLEQLVEMKAAAKHPVSTVLCFVFGGLLTPTGLAFFQTFLFSSNGTLALLFGIMTLLGIALLIAGGIKAKRVNANAASKFENSFEEERARVEELVSKLRKG